MAPEARHRVRSPWQRLSVVARVIEGTAFAFSLLLLVPLLGGPGSGLISSIGAGAITTKPSSSHYYELLSRETGKALDVSHGSQANGGPVIQWPTHSGENQQFQFVPVIDGGYEIVARHSGKLLGVAHDSNADGARIVQVSDIHGIYQQWTLGAVGEGYVTLTNYASGKALSVVPTSDAGAAKIGQWQASPVAAVNQQWQLVKSDSVPVKDRRPAPAGAPHVDRDAVAPAKPVPGATSPSPAGEPAQTSPATVASPEDGAAPSSPATVVSPTTAASPTSAAGPTAAASPGTAASPSSVASPSDASGQAQKAAKPKRPK